MSIELILQTVLPSIVLTLALLIFKNFIGIYLSEKGKNLAQKEDIESITRIIESVKAEHAELSEQIKIYQQLRMASIDTRIKAHQEAFSWWSKITKSDDAEVDNLLEQSAAWWSDNCLYLEYEVRIEFINFLSNKKQFIIARNNGNYDLQTSIFNKLDCLPKSIYKAIQLPEITNFELKKIKES
nr:hypothetical protein [uncultured Tolumonas sp.]